MPDLGDEPLSSEESPLPLLLSSLFLLVTSNTFCTGRGRGRASERATVGCRGLALHELRYRHRGIVDGV